MSKENFEKLLAFEASAGSGKTVALATRYISLLFLGENPSSILAATFTNKAAGEMKGRIIKYLRELHTEKLEFVRISVAMQSNLSVDEIIDRQNDVLDIFLSSANSIVTLDSFFISILRSMALEIGIEPDFVSIVNTDKDRVSKGFLDELDLYNLLGELVNFGSVSNKRLSQIIEFLNTFYKSDSVLPNKNLIIDNISETEAKIEELRLEIINQLEANKATPRAIGQFQTRTTQEIAVKELFKHELLSSHSWFEKFVDDKIETKYSELKQAISLWMNIKESQVIGGMFELYDHYKNTIIDEATRSSNLSFDDIAFFTYRVMHKLSGKDFLYFRLDARYKHILLDEFQDTSILQFLLLKPLIDEIVAGEGQSDFRTLFYVGDTKQSLYRFRGGVEELFPFVAQKYGVNIEQMDTNYRSSKLVVNSVNEWFAKVIENFPIAKSCEQSNEGFVRVITNDEVLDEAIKQLKELLELGVDIDDIAFLVASNSDGYELHDRCNIEGINSILKTKSSLVYQVNISRIVSMISYLVYGNLIDFYPLLLQSKKEFSDVDISWFSPFDEPIVVIDRIVRDFDCYDDNVPILLEYASNYSDILLFLEEFKVSDIAVASGTSHGAVIMTVHGAKGLEFEYTIVLDKFKGEKNGGKSFIFATDDNLNIDHIYYVQKGRENFDNKFSVAKEKEILISKKDSLNVLYVACTRAIEGLILVQKKSKSRFEPLCLEDLTKGKISPPQGKESQSAKISRSVTITNYGLQNISHKDTSQAISYDAVIFGTALHYALEMIEEFDVNYIDGMMSFVGYKYGRLLGYDKLLDIKNRVERLLDNKEFNKLLKGATLHRELPISFNGELKHIDILLEYEDRLLVVDYKSSNKHKDKHREQVGFYTKAITTIMNKPSTAAIIYLSENNTVVEFLN